MEVFFLFYLLVVLLVLLSFYLFTSFIFYDLFEKNVFVFGFHGKYITLFQAYYLRKYKHYKKVQIQVKHNMQKEED